MYYVEQLGKGCDHNPPSFPYIHRLVKMRRVRWVERVERTTETAC